MNIQTKYDIGQEVYAVFYEPHRVQCPHCKGMAAAMINGVLLKCEECGGTGTVGEFGKVIKPLRIRSVEVRVNTEGYVTTRYGLWDSAWLWLEEGQLYPTAEAAYAAL